MPYTQNWGISRNALQSPLNNNEQVGYWDSEKSKWFSPGDEGHDGRTQADRDREIDQIVENVKSGKTTEKPKTEYTKDPKDWSTWPASERPSGWSLPGAKNPDGTDSGNTFTEEELNLASKISENKKSQAMLKGGEEWENSEYNTQPKKGYDHQGNVMKLHEGDKVTLGGKDVTESHNRKLSGEMSTEDQLDNLQGALGVGGFTPGYGVFADGANALISGTRGVASAFGIGDKSWKHHMKKGVASTVYAFPGLGDMAALDKVNKYSKALNTFTRSTGTTYQASKSGKWAQEMFKPHSKLVNDLRGLTSWAVQKNKDTKLGNKFKQLFGKQVGGTVAAATSSKGLVKGEEAADTLSNYASASAENVAPFTTPVISSMIGSTVGPITSTVDKAKSNVDVASTEPKEATNIIEKNVSSTTNT
jgi:hypothetical protein